MEVLEPLGSTFSFFPPKKPPGLQQGGWGWIFETPLSLTCYELRIVGTPHRQFPLLTQPSIRNPSVAPLHSSPVLHNSGLEDLAEGFISNPCLLTPITWDVQTGLEYRSGLTICRDRIAVNRIPLKILIPEALLHNCR
jgi:hypothetical protein